MTTVRHAWCEVQPVEDPNIPKAKAVDVMEETEQVLNKASNKGRAEANRISLDQSAGKTRLDQMVDHNKSAQTEGGGSVEKSLVDSVNRKLAPAMGRVAPEGKKLITQSNNTPAMRAPNSDGDRAVPAKAKPADEDASPTPLVQSKRDSQSAAPSPGNPAKSDAASEAPIDIVNQGALYFDSAQSMAIFTEDVVVNHPQFHLTCDELQVYMLKEGEKGSKEPAPASPALPGAAPQPKQDSSVKQAIATGRKVVIQKRSENGEMQIGIARHATYIGESGDIILREMPQVQRARNLIIATDRSTYMVFKQNGELKVHGPARTEIIQEAAKKGKEPATAADSGLSIPVTKTPPVVKPPKEKAVIKKKDKGASL